MCGTLPEGKYSNNTTEYHIAMLVFVTPKTREIVADGEREKHVSTLNSSSYATTGVLLKKSLEDRQKLVILGKIMTYLTNFVLKEQTYETMSSAYGVKVDYFFPRGPKLLGFNLTIGIDLAFV